MDGDLARRVLQEVAARVEVHIEREYVMDMEELLTEGRIEEEDEVRDEGSNIM